MANYFVFDNDHIFVCSPQHCCKSHTKINAMNFFLCWSSPKMSWHSFWVTSITGPLVDIMNDVSLTIFICNDKSALFVIQLSIFNGKLLCGSSEIYFWPFPTWSLWKSLCSTVSFNFFRSVMVSLFLARHDPYFIMLKNSNVLEFNNFPFKIKYNNTVAYFVNCIYSQENNTRKKLLKQFFDWIYCVFINTPPKLDDFWTEF